MISFCSSHTNGSGGKITYNGQTISYEKIFCLDNGNLTEIYKILHNKDNFNSNVAFILNSDLDFSNADLDYHKLNNGYDYAGNTFTPIGSESYQFNADFYGNNHKIIVGNINYVSNNDVGFFGDIGSSGKVYDLQVKIGNVNGKEDIGSFVGHNNGTISNSSTVVNSVSGNNWVGGFAGENDGTIKNSSVVVNSVSGSEWNVGGFIGYNNSGIIKNSSAVVDSVSGKLYIGGFIGNIKFGTIENSSAVVDSVNSIGIVGGFIGWNNGIIKNSSVVVNTISGSKYFGGFVGYTNGTIENDIAKVLVLSGASSDVSAGYYINDNSVGNSTKLNKQKFFFGNKKCLSYDGTNLIITVPVEKIFNEEIFPSAFSTDNDNWGHTIMTNLSNYWKKW